MAAPVFTASLAGPAWDAQLVDAYGEVVSVIGQSAGSLVYVRVRVNAIVNGTTPYNPTADTVQFGFQNEATNLPSAVPSSWVAGTWETDTIAGLTAYIAKILVGPAGGFTPTAGTNYWLWLKVTDNPEIPVILVGEMKVT